MRRDVFVTVVLALLGTFVPVPGYAVCQETAASDQEQMFNSWLEVINRPGDAPDIEGFIRAHFAPRLLEAFPMDDHVSMFTEIREQHAPLEFHSFRATSDERIDALLRDAHGRWLMVSLYLDAEGGGLIRGIGLDDGVDGPELLDAPKADSLEAFGASVLDYVNTRAGNDQFSGTVLIHLDVSETNRGAWGKASKRYNASNNIETKFNLGSMNKMFTAVAIAQLEEQGRLSFDDLVGKHLPDYPNSDVREKVTIHHLLSHTSGMGSHFTETFIKGAKDRYRHFTDYVPLFADEPLAFEPGERFSYSNAGFFVLGMIIEAVSGESYYDYVRKHIHAPAGMMNTDCYDLDLPVRNIATGYTTQRFDEPSVEDHADWMDSVGPWRDNSFIHSIKGGPAGGGYSTVEDLGRFSQALNRGALISLKQLRIMTTSKTPEEAREDGSSRGYGYGFTTGRMANGTRYFGHSGGFPGINSVLHMFPERGGMIAVMSNYDGGAMPIAAYAERIMPDRK